MEKFTVISKRQYDFVGQSGDQVTGYMYTAFDSTGNAIEFSSKRDDIKVTRAIRFVPDLAQELNIEARLDSVRGKLKYREVVAEVE